MASHVLSSNSRSGSGTRGHVAVPVTQLRTGTRIRSPIWEDVDDRDVLLLAAGTLISPSIVQLLTERGVKKVRVHPNDAHRLTGNAPVLQYQPGRPAPVVETERQQGTPWSVDSNSYVHRVVRHGKQTYDPGTIRKFESEFRQSVATMDRLIEGITAGCLEEAPELTSVSSDALVKIATDMDLFVATGITPGSDGYPGRHSTQTAMMSMAIGTMLGLKRDHLIELGTGCLVHDAGMLRLKIPVLDTARPLSHLEFLEVTKHPAITYDLLTQVRDVPTGARMVAYQMHERCDGSGYPRGRLAPQIHPLAKIAAVADVFVALVSKRAWRPAMAPYKAMEQIIRDAQKGLFDTHVVRALLHAVSLFPIGSFVQTNDGRVGRVVRSNRDRYTTPIVELWTPHQSEEPKVVDLASENGVVITRTLESAPEIAAASSRSGAIAEDFWE